jgi:hypothetical protein
MIAQEKITSGYDVEFLMGEEYIRYFLLTSFETGSIPWFLTSEVRDANGNKIRTDATVIHPPDVLNQKRLYPVHPDFEGNEHPFQNPDVPVYSRHLDEFQVTLLQDSEVGADIRVKVFPSILTDIEGSPQVRLANSAAINLDLKFGLDVPPPGEDGLLSGIGLKIELLDINGPLIDFAVTLRDENGDPVFSKEDTLASMKEQLDRRMDFAAAGGGKIANIQFKKFFADEETPNAIGIYINLALQNGPKSTDLLPDRGNLDDAQNFLPKTSHMAFGFATATYKRLGDDLFQKMAVLKEGTTDDFEYPLLDNGKRIGKILGISVYPEKKPVSPGSMNMVFTNVLIIDVNGEYAVDNFFDPDFHFRIKLIPVQRNGLLDFDIDYDLQLSALVTLVAVVLGFVVTALLPQIGIPLLFLSPLLIRIGEEIGKDAAAGAVQSQLDKTSFLDTLPHKLAVEQRRWDPLYFTAHRVETAVDDLVVNADGFAFSANDLFIGRKFIPLSDMVIRAPTRDGDGAVNGLIYRAKGLSPYIASSPTTKPAQTDLTDIYPAVDRMPYVEILKAEGIETYRVSLTIDLINERLASEDKGAKDKHLDKIQYLPKKVHVIKHQIYKILGVSLTEIPEIQQTTRNLLRSELSAQNGAAFKQQATDELTQELGHAPTTDEVNDRIATILNGAVEDAFPGRIGPEFDRRMKFELEPSEFADLQKKKFLVLGLDKLDIITMHRGDNITVYYRDHERPFFPDADTSDNLLSLPRYVSLSG